MSDSLDELTRDLLELQYLAAQARGEGAWTAAVLYENDAEAVEQKIAALERKEVAV